MFIAAVIVLGLAWTAVGYNHDISVYDEALTAYPAWRILHGDVVYRDFFTLYGPAQFYVTALLFLFTGPALLPLRVLSVGFNFLLCLAVAGVSWRVSGPRYGILSGLFLSTWMLTYPGWPNVPALALGLLSCLCIAPWFIEGRPGAPAMAGSLVAASMLFRHDVGLATAAVQVMVSAAFVFIARRPDGSPCPNASAFAGRYGTGVLAVLVVPVGFLLASVPLETLWENLVRFSATSYADHRWLPYPLALPTPELVTSGTLSVFGYCRTLSSALQYWFPIVALVSAVLMLLVDAKQDRLFAAPGPWWMAMLVLGLHTLYFQQAIVRSDGWHLLGSMATGAALFCYVAHRLAARTLHRSLSLLCLFAVAVLLHPFGRKLDLATAGFDRDAWFTFDLPRARGIWLEAGAARYQDCVQYVTERVPANQPIYVGNATHQTTVKCDVMFYFLAERVSATHHFYLHPGLTTRADTQEAMIRDLEKSQVEYVVLVDFGLTEPNDASHRSGSPLLDEYIRSHYAFETSFGPRTILKRTHLLH